MPEMFKNVIPGVPVRVVGKGDVEVSADYLREAQMVDTLGRTSPAAKLLAIGLKPACRRPDDPETDLSRYAIGVSRRTGNQAVRPRTPSVSTGDFKIIVSPHEPPKKIK